MTAQAKKQRNFSARTLMLMIACFAVGMTIRHFGDQSLLTHASYSNVQPGWSLTVECAADQNVDRKIKVMRDFTIDLHLLGVVSVRGKSVKEIQDLLNQLYKDFYVEPAVEVYRSDGIEPETLAEHP